MESKCEICCLDFETKSELEVHVLSLSHHIKLEANGVTVHHCRQCNFTCQCVSDYSKHVNSEEHRKRRNRLLAIIDTAEDTGDSPEASTASKSDMHKNDRSRPAFSRNDTRRMTCPSRMGHYPTSRRDGTDPGPSRVPTAPPPPTPYNGVHSREPWSSSYREQNRYEPSQQRNYWVDANPPPQMSSFERDAPTRRSYNPGMRSSREGSRTSENRNDDAKRPATRSKKDSTRGSRSSTENDKTAKAADEPKRGIISRLSMRKKNSNVDGCKTTDKEKPVASSSNVDATLTKRSSSEVLPEAAPSPAKKKKSFIPSSLAFAKKQFDLSNFMKRRTNDVRSQQSNKLQRERLQKFKLVDPNRGVEESEEDKTTPARPSQPLNQQSSGRVWGVTPPQSNQLGGDSFGSSFDETTFESIPAFNTSTPLTSERMVPTPTITNENIALNSIDVYSPLGLPPSDSSLAHSMSAAGSSNSSVNGRSVKMEPPSDTPPPPSLQPLDNSQEVSGSLSAELASNVVQTDKFREMWDLTHLEEQNKKKIQELTLQLYQLEQEMHFIQMRKRELMGNIA